MKLEQGWYVLGAAAAAAADTIIPNSHWVSLAVSGAMLGTFIASYSEVQSRLPRLVRAIISFACGIVLAPWFIGYLPKADTVPEAFHIFASSGVSAACGYLIFTEYPKILLDHIRSFRYIPESTNRRGGNDNDSGDGEST